MHVHIASTLTLIVYLLRMNAFYTVILQKNWPKTVHL